jgi:hypothetical protein
MKFLFSSPPEAFLLAILPVVGWIKLLLRFVLAVLDYVFPE